MVGAFVLGSVLSQQKKTVEKDIGNTRSSAELPSLMSQASEQKKDASKSQGEAISTELGTGKSLSEEDIQKLGSILRNKLDPIQSRLAFARLLEGLTAENALQIREQVAHLDDESAEFREFHYAWGAIGGKEAVFHGGETRERDMAATLAGWASADPQAALAWIESEKGNNRYDNRELKRGLIHGLANKDVNIATDYVFQLAEGGNKEADDYLRIVTSKALQAMDVKSAASWSESLPAGALRAESMDRVAHAYVSKDPEAAARWAENFVHEEHSARVIEEVGDEWAERDPVASISWLETLDTSSGKSQAMASALGEWVSKDPQAASEYIVAMPTNSPERDPAISGMVGRLAWEDPSAAIAWAGEIQDSKTRQSTLTRAAYAYYRKQPEEAAQWLPQSGLSEEAQRKVMESRRR